MDDEPPPNCLSRRIHNRLPFTLFTVFPQSFVIALLTALGLQLQCVPHTLQPRFTLVASALGSLLCHFPLVALEGVDLGCCLRSWSFGFLLLAFLLTTAVHSVLASPALGIGSCDVASNFLLAQSNEDFSSATSVFRAVISALSSVTTMLEGYATGLTSRTRFRRWRDFRISYLISP